MSAVCNGILSGLVSVTAGCAAFELRVAPLVGCIGGAVYTIIARVSARETRVREDAVGRERRSRDLMMRDPIRPKFDAIERRRPRDTMIRDTMSRDTIRPN